MQMYNLNGNIMRGVLTPLRVQQSPVPLSIAQFTTRVHKLTPRGVISYSVHISTQGLAGDKGEIRKVIIGHVWEATGFRFAYGWFPLEVQWLPISHHSIRY